MITSTQGNILQAGAEAIVNTVNCVGVMGKGLALQFKQAFPENFKYYKKECDQKSVTPGKMCVFDTGQLMGVRYVINFPTKRHWKGKSKIEDVSSGLDALKEFILESNLKSIAIPPLGAGLGGLNWLEVKKLIVEKLSDIDCELQLYEPLGSPKAQEMVINTKKPNMTIGRALLVKVVDLYRQIGYEFSNLEIQKLMYFLQEAGQPLKLEYKAYKYGPYAEKLNHVLQRIEGHLIKGYGDRKVRAEMELLPNSIAEADEFLVKQESSGTHEKLEKIKSLVEGFETPYGLELLATVHWTVVKEKCSSIKDIINKVHDWNPRKKDLMTERHISVAYNHLKSLSWI